MTACSPSAGSGSSRSASGMIFVAFPFYWMILTAFTPRDALFRPPFQLVRLDFSLGNFAELLFATEFLVYLKNSLIAAAGAIVLNVVAATLAGYGLSRFSFFGKRTFTEATLFSYMFPPMLLAIPLYLIFSCASACATAMPASSSPT